MQQPCSPGHPSARPAPSRVPLSCHLLPPPAADNADLDTQGVTKRLSEMWKAVSAEDKAHFEVRG